MTGSALSSGEGPHFSPQPSHPDALPAFSIPTLCPLPLSLQRRPLGSSESCSASLCSASMFISVIVLRASLAAVIQTCGWIYHPQSLSSPEARDCIFLTLVCCPVSTHWFALGRKKTKTPNNCYRALFLLLHLFPFCADALVAPCGKYLLQFFSKQKKKNRATLLGCTLPESRGPVVDKCPVGTEQHFVGVH